MKQEKINSVLLDILRTWEASRIEIEESQERMALANRIDTLDNEPIEKAAKYEESQK